MVGPSGEGKTGALASLVCAGYKLRILDFDNGMDNLFHLLTEDVYRYAPIIRAKGIDLNVAVRSETITERMGMHRVEKRPVPRTAKGWDRCISMLDNWQETDPLTGKPDPNAPPLGHIEKWENDCVLVFDTFSTLADMAFFHVQALNARLGARMEGFDYQRDIGGAQAILKNLLQMIYDPFIKCNVIINTHVVYVDDSKGIASAPSRNPNKITLTDPKGYPMSIGRALSPIIGKYFNNVLTVASSGTGQSTKRLIWTVPKDGIRVKNAAHASIRPSYPVETGLAQIFAALRGEAPPQDLLKAFAAPQPTQAPQPAPKPALVSPLPATAKA